MNRCSTKNIVRGQITLTTWRVNMQPVQSFRQHHCTESDLHQMICDLESLSSMISCRLNNNKREVEQFQVCAVQLHSEMVRYYNAGKSVIQQIAPDMQQRTPDNG